MSSSNVFFKLLLKAPGIVRRPLIRRIIEFSSPVDPALQFKVAETQEELEQAYSLLHDAYVSEKLMSPHPSGMRVTKYHSLPSTSTLIVKEGPTVIGTVSLVRQSAFGMPLEAIFNLDQLPPGNRPAEVSSLAIKNGMRQQRGRILFPLLKFLFHYSTDYFGVTHFVIAVNPKWYDFYESVLLFNRLSRKTVESYDFVNGAPAIGGYLDLRSAQRRYIPLYGKRPQSSNLAHFFFDQGCLNMEFPFRKKGVISDPVLSPRLMDHFFRKKTDTFEKLTDFERAYLRQLYNSPEYLSLIPSPGVAPISFRKSKRFDTNLRARLTLILKTMSHAASAESSNGKPWKDALVLRFKNHLDPGKHIFAVSTLAFCSTRRRKRLELAGPKRLAKLKSRQRPDLLCRDFETLRCRSAS